MAIIGNPIVTTNYVTDTFSGDNSTVAFTLSVAPASAASIAVYISGLYQIPSSAYTISGTTLTFTGAPPTGTNNITVLHLGVKNQNLVPSAASITPAMLNNANVIYWGTGNTNVGVGTTSPSTKLHLYEAGATDVFAKITSTYADGYDAGVVLENTHTGGRQYAMVSTNDSRGTLGGGKFAIIDKTAGFSSHRLVINSSGYVGIGVVSPAHTLDVSSGGSKFNYIQVTNAGYSGTGASTPEMYSPGASTLAIAAGGAERVRINANGTFQVSGYGNNVPQIRLSTGDNVTTDGVYAAEGGQVRFYQRQNGSTYQRHLDIVSNGDSSYGGVIKLYTNPDSSVTTLERMRIAANGNIGIANTSPVKALHITGGVPQVRINEAGGSYWDIEGGGRFNIQNGSGTIMFSIGQGGTAPIGSGIQIANSGIVTTPSQPAFNARLTSGNYSGTTTIIFNEVWANRGSYYNSSTGVFTAPVAGYYFFSCRLRSSSGEMNPIWVKNGSDQAYFGTCSAGQSLAGTFIFNLAVGDTVSVRQVGGGTVQGGPDYHSIFTGHLLG